jgi:hypothetical protein
MLVVVPNEPEWQGDSNDRGVVQKQQREGDTCGSCAGVCITLWRCVD